MRLEARIQLFVIGQHHLAICIYYMFSFQRLQEIWRFFAFLATFLQARQDGALGALRNITIYIEFVGGSLRMSE